MATNNIAEPLVFGLTLDQADDLHQLARKVTAGGDVFSNATNLEDTTTDFLGQELFEAGLRITEILKRSGEQRIVDAKPSAQAAKAQSAAASGKSKPTFTMIEKLIHAESMAQVLNTAAYQAENAEGMGGTCWCLAKMIQEVIEYVEQNFDHTSERA
jgi:hypothetical protein